MPAGPQFSLNTIGDFNRVLGSLRELDALSRAVITGVAEASAQAIAEWDAAGEIRAEDPQHIFQSRFALMDAAGSLAAAFERRTVLAERSGKFAVSTNKLIKGKADGSDVQGSINPNNLVGYSENFRYEQLDYVGDSLDLPALFLEEGGRILGRVVEVQYAPTSGHYRSPEDLEKRHNYLIDPLTAVVIPPATEETQEWGRVPESVGLMFRSAVLLGGDKAGFELVTPDKWPAERMGNYLTSRGHQLLALSTGNF
jgi:hypothetical protein